jgi:hypothetical protein
MLKKLIKETCKMTEHELGAILKEMYEEGSRKKETVAYIHLFGIKYANEIRNNRLSIMEMIKFAGIPATYNVEVNKGINLSKYVNLK